jgi:hypothetical protein
MQNMLKSAVTSLLHLQISMIFQSKKMLKAAQTTRARKIYSNSRTEKEKEKTNQTNKQL